MSSPARHSITPQPGWRGRVGDYAELMRVEKPIGWLLLLWPALWALWLAAEGPPGLHILLVFVAGVFVTRSAGCVINDFADKDFDPHVARTRERPLAAGRVSPREALVLFAALSLVAFALVLTLNRLTILLSVIGAALTISYPFMKRFTHLPQVHLGFAFGWAVPMAFSAVTGSVPPLAWLTYLAAIVWAVVYDTIYAMVDRDDDLSIGVKSTAILFGEADRAFIGGFQLLLLTVLAMIGVKAGLGLAYATGLVVAAVLAVYQQTLIRRREPGPCFHAFRNNNWFGMAVFAGIALEYALRG
ncbi:MAG: 4-hydroxybenzoate octaprenyltransferase [Gammaproteobacteria bacterium]